MEFSFEGVLFVGDNVFGVIYVIDLKDESWIKEKFEVNLYNVDVYVVVVLGIV